jgi:hypothetical protein
MFVNKISHRRIDLQPTLHRRVLNLQASRQELHTTLDTDAKSAALVESTACVSGTRLDSPVAWPAISRLRLVNRFGASFPQPLSQTQSPAEAESDGCVSLHLRPERPSLQSVLCPVLVVCDSL